MVPSASYCIVILGIKRFNYRVYTGNKLISKETVDYSTFLFWKLKNMEISKSKAPWK